MSETIDRIRGLYAIADSGFCTSESLTALARRFLEGGCRVVQLRMKGSGIGDQGSGNSLIRNVAREIMRFKGEFDFTFIVNDHVDVALAVGADGVHVGENDEKVDSIRKRAPGLIVGFSSHSISEALAAEKAGADYVAFGAIFPTRTKGPGHPVQGLGRLKELVQSLHVPVVAIGGIGRENIDNVLAAGPTAVAMISAISQAPDVAAETGWFVKRIENFLKRDPDF